VLPGRVYNLEDLINTNHDLTKFTDPLGWTHLFSIKETFYPDLIEAFYFNAVISSERSYIASEIKGTKIKLSEQVLAKLLNLPISGHKLYGPSWFKMAGLNKKDLMSEMFEPGTILKFNPPSSQLRHDYKMLHNMCLHSIFPRKGSKNKVTDIDMMMMYHMFNKIKINLPYVFIQHMIHTIEIASKKISLPYGMFLTRVFRHFKVNLNGEDGKNSSTTFTLTNIGRMKHVSEIKDHTVHDQGVKRKRDTLQETEPENLRLLADVVTTQEDHLENILLIPSTSDKGKQIISEGNPSDSRDLGISLEFDSAFEDNLGPRVNKFTSVLLDGFSTIDNPVNTSLFSPLITTPRTTFDSFQQAKLLRNLMKNSVPNFQQLS
jgi:hypothetical protein